MDMEQRHHAERDIFGRKRIGVRDIRGRHSEIGVLKRHALWPARASARVEYQRNIFRRGRHRRAPRRRAGQANHALGVHFRGDDRNALFRRGVPRLCGAIWRTDQKACAGVFQEEAELVVAIRGIERGSGPREGRREKTHNCRQAVGQGDRRGHLFGCPRRRENSPFAKPAGEENRN